MATEVTEIVLTRPLTNPTMLVVRVRRTRLCRVRVLVGAFFINLAGLVLGAPAELEFMDLTRDESVIH